LARIPEKMLAVGFLAIDGQWWGTKVMGVELARDGQFRTI
jgi:hypothetical protein